MLRHSFLILVTLAAAPVLASCAQPLVVLTQASPNPLVKQTQFDLMPVDYTDAIIAKQNLTSMDGAARASWAQIKSAIATDFVGILTDRAATNGIHLVKVTAVGDAPFLIWPRVGFMAGGSSSRSDLRMRVRITTAKGESVDEIAVRHTTPDDATHSAADKRLRADSQAIAATVADYLKQRVSVPASGDARGGALLCAEQTPEAISRRNVADSQARAAQAAQAAEQKLASDHERLWSVWAEAHHAAACEDALHVLTSDSECTGAACRAPLVFSGVYQKKCQIDTDTRISLHKMRRRWEEAAGTASPCFEETFRALTEPAGATTQQEKCEHVGKTETALRDAVRASKRRVPSSFEEP